MAYNATIRRYLADLQHEYNSAIRGGQHTAELSYRPVLDRLIKNLANDLRPGHAIDVVLEPRNQGRVGRPDWRIHDSISLGIFGYIEAKGLSAEPFNTAPYQEQFDRYLTLGHKLVITDGIDFVFCMQQGVAPVVVSLIDKNSMNRADWSRIQPNPQFEIFMRQFFDNPAPQQCDEGKLVELVALRTKLLADDICHYASIPFEEAMNEDERQSISLLSGIKALVYNHNDSNMRTDTYSFVPAKPFNEDQYNRFWAVSGEAGQRAIFCQHCSGIKLAPTAIFTHVMAPMLKRRCRDILTGGAIVAHDWFSGQDRKPEDEKIVAFQAALNSCGGVQSMDATLSANIKRYSFRPYLTSNVLLWQDVLRHYATVGGGGTRLRPEIVKGFSNPNTIGFAMAHAPKDLNPTLSQFVSFCWYYPDNDMCTRGNSHIYMNQYADKRTGEFSNNISQQLLESLSEILHLDNDCVARNIVFYVYAILCSQVYLDEFEGALFTVNQSDKRARVPVVADPDVFMRVVSLGEQLAQLEKADYVPNNLLNFDYEDLISQVPTAYHLRNTTHPFDEENEQLILTDGHTEIRVDCPMALQTLNISGYDVVKNVWLKFHSYDFTHCDFDADDMRNLLNLLNTLEMHTRLVAQIDNVVATILNGHIQLINPNDQENG